MHARAKQGVVASKMQEVATAGSERAIIMGFQKRDDR